MTTFPPPPSIPGVRAEGELLNNLRHEVAALLQRGNNTRFPGAQPVSFARQHLQELLRRDYYVCEKSDGIRCLMYLTCDGPKETTFLIDRKNDYYYVEGLHFPLPNSEQDFYTETIVDGELVNDRQPDGSIALRYLVFDCLCLPNTGQPLVQRTLDKRLGYFRERVYNPHSALYKKYPNEKKYLPFEVAFKHMSLAYGVEQLFRQTLPNLPHGNDGIIFTCRDTPYKFGTDPDILKWKPAKENSVDFRVVLRFPLRDPSRQSEVEGFEDPYTGEIDSVTDYHAMPDFDLYIGGDNKNEIAFGNMHVTSTEWETLKAMGEPLDYRIVECYQDDEHRWRYMRFRDDKKEPNHISTVESVMESINDRISEEDLISISKRVRDAWKEREKAANSANGVVTNGHRIERIEQIGGPKRKFPDGDDEGNSKKRNMPQPPPM